MKISSDMTIPWHLQILARVKNHVFLKSVGFTLFMLVFFAGYIYLLNNPVFPVTVMPLTVLDEAVEFNPDMLLLYVSLWLYVTLPPALQASRRELIYYGLAIGMLCVFGLACFLFWPTAVPAANVDWEQGLGFSILKSVDAAGNACPSLHVATAVFSAMWLNRQLLEVGAPRIVLATNWIWCVGIAYSTLATKQHVAIDLIAGMVLGVFSANLSLMKSTLMVGRFAAEMQRRP